MKYAAIALLMVVVINCTGGSSVKPISTFKTAEDSIGYAIGVNIGSNFKSQELDIEMAALLSGLLDAMSEDSSAVKLTEEQMETVFVKLQQTMQEKQMKKMEEMSRENQTKNDAFFKENASKEGVQTTASGLQYRVIKEGSGRKPTPESQVVVHYRGRLLDGTEFDSSYQRNEPATFQVGQVIQGWIEGLQLMSAGSTFEFYIPANLAYGEEGNPVIPPNSALIFEVELLEIK
jgi:FKBP-type peptidyl-prolyl cis-trans isomerase